MAAEHPVRVKLRLGILPYLVQADRLRRRPIYVTYVGYIYVHDFLAALVGFGFSTPLLKVLGGAEADTPHAAALLSPSRWLPLTVICLIAWAALKVVIAQSDAAKKVPLQRSCRRECQVFRRRLTEILLDPAPIARLNDVQRDINAMVDRLIAEGAWPFDDIDDDNSDLNRWLTKLSETYSAGWDPAPASEQR
jgi:hypothetical protein